MEPEKKLRTRVYGAGKIYHSTWSKHSRQTGKRVKRLQKRSCKAEICRLLQGDE